MLWLDMDLALLVRCGPIEGIAQHFLIERPVDSQATANVLGMNGNVVSDAHFYQRHGER